MTQHWQHGISRCISLPFVHFSCSSVQLSTKSTLPCLFYPQHCFWPRKLLPEYVHFPLIYKRFVLHKFSVLELFLQHLHLYQSLFCSVAFFFYFNTFSFRIQLVYHLKIVLPIKQTFIKNYILLIKVIPHNSRIEKVAKHSK